MNIQMMNIYRFESHRGQAYFSSLPGASFGKLRHNISLFMNKIKH
jgi:hypothetical protein